MAYQSEVARFRHRPTEIQAVQWTDANGAELAEFAGDRFLMLDAKDRIPQSPATAALRISSSEPWRLMHPGDWVIKRNDGVFDVLRGGEFTDHYEAAPAECICTDDAWPPHCPRHGIDA